MKEVKKITFDELNKVNYSDLKAKFIDLGVEKAWKGGTKKGDLINRALKMLSDIKVAEGERAVEVGVLEEDGLSVTVIDASTEEVKDTIVLEAKTEIVGVLNEVGDSVDVIDGEEGEILSVVEITDTHITEETKENIETTVEEVKPNVTANTAKATIKAILDVVEESPIVKPKYSQETIETALKTIEKNLKNNIPAQKPILLNKKRDLLEMLEFYVQ